MMQQGSFKIYESKEALEKARALEASQLSYTERFHLLMRLIKTSIMISNAKIVASPKIGTSK